MTFLTHPEHGATNVRPDEVEEHEKNGWKVSTREEWMGKKLSPVVEESVKRRGRPPKAE